MRAILACLAYSASSCTMVLLNKAVLSRFDYNYKACIMALQGLVALSLMLVSKRLGVLQFKALSKASLQLWFPVNIFFTLMLYTSFESLKRLHVPSVTIFKNVTNIVIAAGAWWWFGEKVNLYVGLSLGMVVLGALLAGATDLSFDLEGYTWMAINCVSTAAYVLYMRGTVKAPLSAWDKAFLNNAISVPLSLLLATGIGEIPDGITSPELTAPAFIAALALSGCVGFALNLTSLWCVSETSATTYSMVGALNKIPLAVLGTLLFGAPMDARSGTMVAFGLAAGMVYAYAKTIDPDRPPTTPLSLIRVSPMLEAAKPKDSPTPI
ncbi:hypothetical protein FNF28_05012 [Cafeteria roenbergensis]|uniref:Sugar phosphate transporter domain-containing protein n=1 Tax=Cafeteria roenbergensis TaxID=33653 RepID=A0A5A8D8P6_CAFRO|nr:hypothetical protein FNF28_05012 [Cafeteria roenbergensis]